MPLIDASHPSICGAPLLFMLKQNKKRKIRVFKAVVVLGQKNKKIDFFSRIEFDECKKIKRKRK
jgi:hypothetical protein